MASGFPLEPLTPLAAFSDNPAGGSLLNKVKPTFIWVRMTQRIPVRIRINPASLPDGTHLAAGMTAPAVRHDDRASR